MEIVGIIVAQVIILIIMLCIQNNYPLASKGQMTAGVGLEIMVVIPLLFLADNEKNIWIWVLCLVPVIIGGVLFNRGLSLSKNIKQDA